MLYYDGMEVERMEQVLNTILSELKEMRSDIHDLKQGQQSFHEDLKVLKVDVSTLKNDNSTLKDDVAILKDDVTTIKDDVKVLQSDVAVLKDDVASLKSGQTRIVSLISDIPKQFDVLKNSIGLDLERHQRILDLLSTKSIEHEADIKYVKSMIQN